MIHLTSTGARSGRPSRIEIWAWWFEDRYLITGLIGKRDWMANVTAKPSVTVHLRGYDLPGTATSIDDVDFKRRFFTTSDSAWDSSQSELEHLVDQAPMIEIVFDR